MDDWITADSIVKSWIFLTLSSTLRKRLIKANPKTAKDAWDTIEAIFQDNKRTRVVALKGELRMIQIDDVVTYAINGLSDKYESLAQIIAHKEPFPDLSTVRSMVFTEEMRIRKISIPSLSVSTKTLVLLMSCYRDTASVQDNAPTNERDNVNNNKTMQVYRNFGRGCLCMVVPPAGYIMIVSFRRYRHQAIQDFRTRQILLRCDSTGDLYPVTSLSYPQAFLVGQQTWHQRLGHPGSDVLRSLVSNNLISCNKTKSPVLCHACQLGKHVRLPFSLSKTIVKSPFDIIHSDLWTSPITSVSGIKYYVLFLDHFSHYLWVYPLRNKSDALSKFIHFRAYVKNQFKTDIKSLQCDHGGEFDNNALHQLFASNGITIRFSCPKTSQQNGKSERMIRTINNLIRTLLFQAHLPPTFWVEALHMAAYLLNLLPSSAINNEIPHTRLFKTQPNYADLRVFGCLCYPYINTNHKLEPRATPAIFLGYPTNHRGYRCLDLNTDKIILSRHVTFDETVFPYGSMTPNEPPSYTFLDTSPNIIQQHLLTKLISSPSPNTTTRSTPNNNPPSNTTPHQIFSPTQPTIHGPLPNS
ncbi:ribonuclease H-like domain-containing protein [Tanacetum coccineum]